METSSARVLNEGEQRLSAWTVLSPVDRNVKLSIKLEEKILILVKRNMGRSTRLIFARPKAQSISYPSIILWIR